MHRLLAAVDAESNDAIEQLGELTLSDWIWAGALTLVALIGATVAKRVIKRLATPQVVPFVALLLSRLGAVIVFLFGFFYAMQRVGVSLAPFLGLAGLLGLALAFAFQEVLENFIAGVFLSARRPFHQGDEITTADHDGVVEDISLRELTMRTYDGERVFIPNSSVWRNPIVNHTTLGSRRTTLAVGVAYDSSLDSVGDLLRRAAASVDGVHADPGPEAVAYEFGGSSINFAVRFWHDPSIADVWRVRDEVTRAVHRVLNEAGVEIPFPQRVVSFTNPSDIARLQDE